MRDEHLNGQLLDTLVETQVPTEDWRIDDHERRPHSEHGWKPPAEFARVWTIDHQLV